ncbi:MAG: type I DNA topoisomerase [Chloroflexota bacterium]
MSNVLIVESPGKIKKIASFLGEGWIVEASGGHVRDLPDDSLGIDLANRFTPQYCVLKSRNTLLNRLKKAVKAADAVYLATDPDREGEAIAWHLMQLLKTEVKGKAVHRITFTSITEKAIREAITAPRQLDIDLIEAQQTRRVVDRLVGYLISPLACKIMHQRVSAGRVQSVCLRLVVDRERELNAFVPSAYWTLDVRLNTGNQDFTARLITLQGKKAALNQQAQVDKLIGGLTGKLFWIDRVEWEEKGRRPLPPFTTSSLQQAASKALGLAPEQTMATTQALYEAGYITYLRTDSVSVAPEAQAEALDYIAVNFGQASIPALPQVYLTQARNAQEAHEAIRPTRINRLSSELPDGDSAKLYDLIWKRFVASQMADASYSQIRAVIHCGEPLGQPYPLEFEAKGRTLVFEGFLKLYEEALDDGEVAEQDTALPRLSAALPLVFGGWEPLEYTTQAPARYTEASLVHALEQRGLGRPSTYASMVKVIKEKGYVQLNKKRLVPTATGIALLDFLVQRFPIVFDYDYTASLESDLDRVAAGKTDRLSVVQAFWAEKFSKAFQAMLTEITALGPSPSDPLRLPKVLGKCPKCGGDLVERHSAKGTFAGCSNYPKCTGTVPPVRFRPAKKGKVHA